MTRYGLIFAAGLVLLIRGVGLAEEEGIDIFLKAVVSQQTGSVIFSGEASYEMNGGVSKTDEEIQKEAELIVAEHNTISPGRSPLDLQEVLENLRAQYAEQRRVSGNFRFDYSQKELQYVETQMIYDDNDENPVTVIEKRDPRSLGNKKSVESAMFDSSISQVIVSHTWTKLAEFEQFGRARGVSALLVSALVQEKGEDAAREGILELTKKLYGNKEDSGDEDVSILKIVDRQPYENDATAYTIETAVKGQVTQRYVIVPEMGYICPKIEIFDNKTGKLIQEYEASDFVLHQSSGLYYPTRYREFKNDRLSGSKSESWEYVIDQETLSLNEKMSPNDFTLDLPKGTVVADSRDGNSITFIAEESGTLSLEADGFVLDKLSWLRNAADGLSKSNHEPDPDQPRVQPRGSLPRILLAALGIMLILLAVIIRRRKRKNAEK